MPKANPHVFLDLSIGGRVGRITFELFADIVPRTAENFRALCTGRQGRGQQTGKQLTLKQTHIYRIVRGFVAQGGDLSNMNGLVGESIYGGTFTDENFERKHDKRGLLSMANSGPHSNGSLFFITLNPLPDLDGKHVVFGEAVSGVELLDELEDVSTVNGRPSCKVLISDCGQVDTNTQDSRDLRRKKKRRHHSSDSTDENSNDGHRKRRSGKDKHKHSKSDSDRKKKRKIHSSDSYSDDSSDAAHGRKRRSYKKKHKSLKRGTRHRDSKRETRRSRRKSRRNHASSSGGSSASTSDDERGG